MESDGGRRWFRLWQGRALVADHLGTPTDVERELKPYGLTLADFEPEPGNDE